MDEVEADRQAGGDVTLANLLEDGCRRAVALTRLNEAGNRQ